MLAQCRASVTDDGTTLKQRWVNVSCFLGYTNAHQCWIIDGPASWTLVQLCAIICPRVFGPVTMIYYICWKSAYYHGNNSWLHISAKVEYLLAWQRHNMHSQRPVHPLPLKYNRPNPLTAKLFNWNFHPLEVVSRWRDPQLQVTENYSDLTKWRSTRFKSCWLMSPFIFNMVKRWYIMCY